MRPDLDVWPRQVVKRAALRENLLRNEKRGRLGALRCAVVMISPRYTAVKLRGLLCELARMLRISRFRSRSSRCIASMENVGRAERMRRMITRFSACVVAREGGQLR